MIKSSLESSNPPQSAKMQLTTTFVLLAIAAYVHADDTCIPCPATVDGQSLQTICSLGGETTCAYTGGNEVYTGPFCVYWNYGQYLGYCDYGNSDPNCPLNMGQTLVTCDPTYSVC
ncbi:hypothetical protein BKA82DRAFT_4165109 [Pisolithus tinctorius]|nr:hypothetical protein BKA82DRAFT_4165109 [Pisolithus tinctorius]